MKYPISAVIFAGGKSSRMGTDKALLPFSVFHTLSEYQYHKLSPWFRDVYISAKTNKFNFKCQIIKDNYEDSSPLVGIISVFETLKEDAIFILSVDAPLVNKSIIDKLWEVYTHNAHKDAIIAKSPSGIQPLCGIYRHSILPIALNNLLYNKHRLTTLFGDLDIKIVPFSDNQLFANLNTQEEYKKLLHSNLF